MANEERAGSARPASRKQFREMLRRGGREGNLRRGIWIALMAE
jgi:hypothetical protein